MKHIGLAVIVMGCVLIGFGVSAALAQGKARGKVLKGNELFEQGKYDEANNYYQDAKLDRPTDPIIDYNIANTLYEKKKYEEALKLYDEVLKNSDDPLLQAKAYYNMGNALYRLNKLPESILAYKEALKLNPDDEDAKYNLEYVRAKLKQESQKQPQQPQNQQQQQNQQDENQQQQDQQQQNQEQQNQDEQQNQQEQQELQQQPNQENEDEQQQQQQQQQVNPEDISKEEAERILNALQNQEKDLQKARKMKAKGRRRSTKDW